MLSVESWRWHVRMAGMTNFLLGVLLSAWPYTQILPLMGTGTERYFVITGTLISICGACSALLPRRSILPNAATLILGFCVLVSPIPYEVEMNWPMLLVSISTGLVLMVLAWWSISETLRMRRLLR